MSFSTMVSPIAEPAPCTEPPDTPWGRAKHFDFIYEVAKERGTKVEF